MHDGGQKVVVITNMSIEMRADEQMFAAHLVELGITAYGRTAESARSNVKQAFNKWVNLYREVDALPQRLNELGVEWQPLDEYNGTLPVEDTDPKLTNSEERTFPEHHELRRELERELERELNRELAMAA